MSDKTTISWPQDIVRFWWTGYCRYAGQTRVGLEFVARVGHFRGTPVEFVRWLLTNLGAMRTPIGLPELQATECHQKVWVQTWGNASDMLFSAARSLETLVPQLVQLPTGAGILYLGSEVSEEDWLEMRDLVSKIRQLKATG